MTEGLGRHRPKAPVAGMFASNEELGKLSKKDDDHRPARVVGGHWHPPRRRKLMYTVVGLVLLWLIYHWHPRLAQSPVPSQQEAMPIPSVAFRAPIEETHAAVIENKLVDAVYEAAAAVAGAKTNPEHSYNGDIEFYALPSTIRPVGKGYVRSAQAESKCSLRRFQFKKLGQHDTVGLSDVAVWKELCPFGGHGPSRCTAQRTQTNQRRGHSHLHSLLARRKAKPRRRKHRYPRRSRGRRCAGPYSRVLTSTGADH